MDKHKAQRVYMSGNEKRKRKLEKEHKEQQVISKTKKLSDFFISTPLQSSSEAASNIVNINTGQSQTDENEISLNVNANADIVFVNNDSEQTANVDLIEKTIDTVIAHFF